mgnify:CR=1 FL=1
MKLKVCKPQKSGEQISDGEAGTVNAAADNAETSCSAVPEQGRTEPDGTQQDYNSARTRMYEIKGKQTRDRECAD